MIRSVTGLPDNPDDYDAVCGNGPYPRFCPHGINLDAADCGKCLDQEREDEQLGAALAARFEGRR